MANAPEQSQAADRQLQKSRWCNMPTLTGYSSFPLLNASFHAVEDNADSKSPRTAYHAILTMTVT